MEHNFKKIMKVYPFSIRVEITEVCPFLAANIRAVQPLSLFPSMSTTSGKLNKD